MASPIDLSLLGGFLRIFVSILVFVFVFAILKKINILGKKDDKSPDSIYALIALFVSILFMLSNPAYIMISSTMPWFAVFFIFLVLGIVPFMILGATDDDVKGILTSKKYKGSITTWIIAVAVVILIVGFVSVSQESMTQQIDQQKTPEQQLEETQASTSSNKVADPFWNNILSTLTNKKVLGIIVFLMIAYFVITNLTKPIIERDN